MKAKATGQVNDSWGSRLVRLNVLPPQIVEAILAGTQPAFCQWNISTYRPPADRLERADRNIGMIDLSQPRYPARPNSFWPSLGSCLVEAGRRPAGPADAVA